MDFDAVLEKVLELLQRQGRATYRALKLRYDLTDEYLETLKEELLYTHPEVADDEGRGLIWNGAGQEAAPQPASSQPQSQPPSTYTPQHLAERRRRCLARTADFDRGRRQIRT